jgi:hypothetical protein
VSSGRREPEELPSFVPPMVLTTNRGELPAGRAQEARSSGASPRRRYAKGRIRERLAQDSQTAAFGVFHLVRIAQTGFSRSEPQG